ncbi:MAG: PA14 domain-containing protein [Ginsengibacter sp.]
MRLFVPALFILAYLPSFSQTGVSVLTQHNNLNRTGWNDKETILNHSNITSGKFGCIGTLSVDDEVYAQPLVVNHLTIGNYTGSVLYVATVNNTVYAFDGEDVSRGAPLWQINLSPPGKRAPNIFDLTDATEGSPCGGNYRDFSGRFGIVGTPVIDTASNTLYVATKTIDNNGNFYAYINALDIKTGLHKQGSPHLISAGVDGNGAGTLNGKIAFLAKYQNQRPALLLYNNTVYVASASHCDWGPYHGWILGFDANTLNLKYTYNATPDGWAGGIWMAGQGISIGGDGNLYVVTGNGTTNPDNTNTIGGRSESLIKLSPQLAQLDWFTPANYDYLDQMDLDYGSDGALIIPNSSLTISGSKEGISYVVDYKNMGKFNAANAQVKDTLEFNPSRVGFVHVHGSPVYANLSTGEFVYAWAESFKIRQFTFQRSTGTFSKTYMQGSRNLDNGMPGAMLSVSSNGPDTSSAVLWACFPFSGNANNQVRPGTIAAYNAGDVSGGELWNSDMDKNDAIGNFAKFNTPTIANGKVYAPTFSKEIKVYGLACNNSIANLQYGNGTGLKGEYYTNSTAASDFPLAATTVQLDAAVNFNWGSGSPAPGISMDNFKVKWTGKINPLTDGSYTFYVTASDGVRLWVNNTLIIDSWSDKPVTTNNGIIVLQKSIDYDIRLEYYSNTGDASCILQWSAAGICKQNIPASQLFASAVKCTSNGNGLVAEYFSDLPPAVDFPVTATVKKTEPVVDFDWGQGSPAGISNDNFKARFSGYVQGLDAGTYTFYVTADDGVLLWVNNKLLIDKWIDEGTTEYAATIDLDECAKNAIRLEYYEHGGNAVCKLEWSGPLTRRQVIPVEQLFTEADIIPVTKEFTIYPNPNTVHSFTISSNASLQQGGQVIVYNMTGQVVIKKAIAQGLQSGKITVPHNLARGVYIVRLSADNKIFTGKLMVL